MRMSSLVFRTLREQQTEAELVSHQLLLRAGLIRQVASGVFSYLPIGYRVKRRIEAIIRSEMESIGGQEVAMPVVHPSELWRRSGRWDQMGDDLARFSDRSGRELCLGMTHEEVVTDLAAHFINSYRVLPCMLFQMQTKFRDEPRPRGGLIRVREFTMKDGYSFHEDADGLDAYYPSVYQAYFNVFRRCDLDVISVSSDTGMMGGTMAHEFMALTDDGEDTLLLCGNCEYRANRQIATSSKETPQEAAALQLEEVETPDTTTINTLAPFLGIRAAQTAKAVFMVGETVNEEGIREESIVFAVVRGDMELNETKLANAVRAVSLRPATDQEILGIGSVPGYGSPVGLDPALFRLVVDDLIPISPNLVAGANREGYHLQNVNYGRDFTADTVADIAAAGEGDLCNECGAPLHAARGIEVGNTFKLGTKYSEAMDASFLNECNQSTPLHMGCYGIGVDRLIATIIEHHHDENGIKWPLTVAPYQIALICLGGGDDSVKQAADDIYERLKHCGLEILYDDRDERAGVKFNDADLIGIPLRLTVGGKGLQRGIVESKIRRTGEQGEIALDEQFMEGVLDILDSEGSRILDSLEGGDNEIPMA